MRNRRLGRIEALKILRTSESVDPDFARRFLQEVQLSASLEHPNIASVYDAGEVRGTLWYTLRFVDGVPLSKVAAERGVLDGPLVARLALPLLDALAYSHERGIVHRDVKPANILVDRRGTPYLLDFGIAKVPDSLTKTQAGVLIGTPAYVSPEQARGGAIDGRSDLYSLGVTLFSVLSGRFPFEVKGGVQAVFLRLSEDPVPLSTYRPDIDPALEAIVMKALAREPDDRFASALEMRDAFELYLAEKGPRATLSSAYPRIVPEGAATGAAAATAATAPPVARTAPPLPPAPVEAPAPETVRPGPPRRRVWPLAVAGYVLFLGAALGLYSWRRSLAPRQDVLPAATVHPLEPTAAPSPTPTPVPPLEPTAAPSPTPVPSVRSAPRQQPDRASLPEGFEARPVRPPERMQGDDPLPAGLPESCSGAIVDVSFTVGADGVPGPARVISRDHPECQPFALRIVAGWTFRPALDARGRPVSSRPVAAAIQF